jgi:hypothetical protein
MLLALNLFVLTKERHFNCIPANHLLFSVQKFHNHIANHNHTLLIQALPWNQGNTLPSDQVLHCRDQHFQLYHGDQVTVVVEKTGVSRENHSMSATHVSN